MAKVHTAKVTGLEEEEKWGSGAVEDSEEGDRAFQPKPQGIVGHERININVCLTFSGQTDREG